MSISLEQVSKSYDEGAAVSDVTVDIGADPYEYCELCDM